MYFRLMNTQIEVVVLALITFGILENLRDAKYLLW
jgi:hypothetical protein